MLDSKSAVKIFVDLNKGRFSYSLNEGDKKEWLRFQPLF